MTLPQESPRRSRARNLAASAFVSAIILILLPAAQARGMGFYGTVRQTLAQDINASDLAVIGKLIALAKPEDEQGAQVDGMPMATFEIEDVLKGSLKGAKIIEAPYFDEQPVGSEYLLLGDRSPNIVWTPPYAISSRGRKYVSEIIKLPPSGAERLTFFQDYLEDKESLLSIDAYYEFDLAPYTALLEMKARMQHDKLVEWLKDPETLASRRRLYAKMLGVCGAPGDLPMLEAMLRSDNPKLKSALDATVACYLTLKGTEGLPLIEKLFLKKKRVEFTEVFSVIMALRYLGQQPNHPIPRDRLIAEMRLVLDHPQLADQAIMDLARWQDWSVMDRLVSMFSGIDPKNAVWVRLPIINYLRECPSPKARQYIEQLRKVDPRAVLQSEKLYVIPTNSTPTIGTQPAAVAPAASIPGAAKQKSIGSLARLLPISGLIAGMTIAIGVIAMTAVARGRRRREAALAGSD